MKKLLLAVAATSLFTACTRIETGEVGLRIGLDKQVNMTELQPGSFNQTLVGDVITMPVRDINLALNDLNAQTADNSTLADYDITVIYSINPASVAELWTTKSKGFHAMDNGDYFLMYNYMTTLARSAAYKAARKHEALKVADNRTQMEVDIVEGMRDALKNEKLDSSLTVTQVQIRAVAPAKSVVDSANNVLAAQNALKTKLIEVDTAKAEAQRLAALSDSKQAITYMNAKAMADIAEGIKNGNVKAVVVPYDFRGIVNVKTD